MKILDTDHCVSILRARLDLGGFIQTDDELGITAISVSELTCGAGKSQQAAENLARLDVLLAAMTVLPYDEWAARRFGELKARLERSGERLDDPDLQIACIALENQATLVTHKQAHFSRLVDLAGLELEDWLAG